MKTLTQSGRLLYSIGIIAIGIHQLILNHFRQEFIPPLPVWLHHYPVFPILTGVALIIAGIFISGLFPFKQITAKKVCLYLGFFFLALIVIFHLPYIFFFSQYKATRLDVWFSAGMALSYSGGAFVMAGTFTETRLKGSMNSFESFLEQLIPAGRVFYSILIILFGLSHFFFTAFVATMVPKWLGLPLFWTYFVGAALIGAGVAIIFKLWIKPVALLLAFMLFLFFIFFHVPDAIAHPVAGGGNEIVRAIIALLFCGIALVIASPGPAEKTG